jgi:outer membrane lipoprotein-sorting protein
MKQLLSIIIFLLLSYFAFSITAEEIIKAIDDNLTFDEGEINISIVDIKNKKINKTFSAKIKYKKDKGTLMEFTSPAREKNKKILLVKDNMWMFVPGVSKPIRLSGKDSFMGTSLSNRDLMDYDMSNDYKSKILEITEKEYKLELNATNKNVPYPKVIIYIEKEKLLPIKEELYTISGNLIKIVEYSEIKNLGGKLRPSVMIMKDVLTQGNETKIVVENMMKKEIKENIFSPQNIEK